MSWKGARMNEALDISDFSGSRQERVPLTPCPWKRVGVVGGLGEMGQLFSRFFRDRGCQVVVSDRDTEWTNEDVIRNSDLVLFAVPLHETVTIIRESLPFTRPDQLLMDLTSLKTAPVHEMLRSPASVVGLHPMFGGRIASFSGQTLVACPARIADGSWSALRGVFTEEGIRVKECTPEEHDRMMSIIQVLFHMTTMLTGRVLRDLGVDIAETMEYTSPSYRLEINLLGRIFAQNSALYSAITQMNPHTMDIIRHFREGLDRYASWVEKEDLGSFIDDFEKSARHLGDFCREAYRESSMILDYTVRTGNSTR